MKNILLVTLLIISNTVIAQTELEINGYLQNMQTVWFPKHAKDGIYSNSINNRLNFQYFPSDNINFNLGLRNIFDYGQFVSLIPNYKNSATYDDGLIDLTKKITSNKSTILYSNIDRLNIFCTYNDLEVQIGRQRINLGINMVWTPNDIFNSSSFINFDYEEKPGSDAIRLQYYLDYASSIQLISKIDKNENLTLAAVIKANQWDYDFQAIAGFSEEDYIFGGGWSGNIYGAGFSGEFTTFKNKDYNDEIVVSSIGANYTFTNSLLISFEFLYNNKGIIGKKNATNNLFNIEYSAKTLSPSRYSLFLSTQYPITPLLNSSISTILNPSDGSLFVNPSLNISLTENVYLLTAGQFFIGNDNTEWGNFGQFYYLRIKWNF